jgi:hypothetical protein
MEGGTLLLGGRNFWDEERMGGVGMREKELG